MKTPTPIPFLQAAVNSPSRLWAPTSLLAATMLLLSAPSTTFASSATWDLNPGSGDWNTATNWSPPTVPNGSADTATFGLSNTTAISISATITVTTVNGITFAPGASSFTITVSPSGPPSLTLSGAGITNNSGTTQNFVTLGGSVVSGQILFTNSATAGISTTFTNNGGAVSGAGGGSAQFFGGTAANGAFTNNGGAASGAGGGSTQFFGGTAANGTFTNNGGTARGAFGGAFGGSTQFVGGTAANGTFTNNGGTVRGAGGGFTAFLGTSSAADATFTNNGGTVSGAHGGSTQFFGGTAANGTFTNNGGMISGANGGFTQFYNSSTAGNGTFTNDGGTVSGAHGGTTEFHNTSTADSATLIANGGMGGGQGGAIFFEGHSTGGTSRVEVFGNGNLDISFHHVTIGSIEGDGNAFLGANLTVGSNSMDTTFSGVIQDGGQNGGTGGSLTKIGPGTLALSGVNTYSGNTNINGGVLKVDGSIRSNTFVHHLGTLAGTGTVHRNVTNKAGTVSPGPGTLTVNRYTQSSNGRLLIDIAGANTGQFSVLDVLGNANLNGILDPVLLNGFIPTIGESFIFLNYAALTGVFSTIQNQTFDNHMEQWSVIYQPTYAILTVGPNTVPDQPSTLLLLTFGLLGLSGYRRRLLREQA